MVNGYTFCINVVTIWVFKIWGRHYDNTHNYFNNGDTMIISTVNINPREMYNISRIYVIIDWK